MLNFKTALKTYCGGNFSKNKKMKKILKNEKYEKNATKISNDCA